MKNLVALASVDEIETFVGNLWKSDLFRESHQRGGYVFQQVLRFAYMPRMFAEMSNDQLERSHFSTWWNVIMLREYDNPFINDLYYLHEMTHAASMPYVDDIGRAAFEEKMQRNELEASVLSEIAIYFEMAGLREQSFGHTIYADRYLGDPHMQRLWARNPDTAMETLRTKRRDVMVSKNEKSLDKAEQWIRRFNDQNAVYFNIWSQRFKEVENQMAFGQRMALEEHEDARKMALHGMRQWIEREAALDPVDNIPFRREAELFAPVYWSNKADYDADMSSM